MRVPIVEYVALALSSGIDFSAYGPPSQAVEVAPFKLGATVSGPNPSCWASSVGVTASYGSLNEL